MPLLPCGIFLSSLPLPLRLSTTILIPHISCSSMSIGACKNFPPARTAGKECGSLIRRGDERSPAARAKSKLNSTESALHAASCLQLQLCSPPFHVYFPPSDLNWEEKLTIAPKLRFWAFQVPTSPARLDRYDTRNGYGDLMQKREGACVVREVQAATACGYDDRWVSVSCFAVGGCAVDVENTPESEKLKMLGYRT
ncbi:hypothetical protein ASPACDRAFT_1866805 [Aspergillus aculeatus ATCC 16872]|uniref:Uncharacterized protein n=1 Tax=Aspergillus aculeatus (strain ATCC 16872 / CBS 172.66 / WB 5094) TaxID=690307 RepID=A0A1L9WZ65_ASPA1|nr:uncharacterized protein ASPACDRAFT_1866805 [Aspergillus aculeatus ATCC 16872]OJK01366.1 hypothetical protein ASPACDRAFT_1866805 [Aspergillus aculeatus ATCC 16872]